MNWVILDVPRSVIPNFRYLYDAGFLVVLVRRLRRVRFRLALARCFFFGSAWGASASWMPETYARPTFPSEPSASVICQLASPVQTYGISRVTFIAAYGSVAARWRSHLARWVAVEFARHQPTSETSIGTFVR